MSARYLALALVALLALPLALADPPKPSPAPDLGPAKYTIHTSGTLHDMIESLKKMTHRQIWLANPPNHGAAPPPPKDDIPVALNFDNATLSEILVSLCTQTGLVYEVQPGYFGGGGAPIMLRPGEPALDSRPTCYLKDYIVRLIRLTNSRSRTETFRWGTAVPERQDQNDRLQIGFEVTPLSAEASLRLAGLAPAMQATPDVGAPIAYGDHGRRYYVSQVQHQPFASSGGPQTLNTSLPMPDPAARMLKRLEGSLSLYSQVKVTRLRIPAAGGTGPGGSPEGQTFTQDDIKFTVRAWKMQGTSLTIDADAVVPQIQRDPHNPWYQQGWQRVALVGKDGRQAQPTATSTGGGRNVTLSFTFDLQPGRGPNGPGPAIVPDALVVTFYRNGPPNVTVPFVLDNVPLP